MSHAVGASAFIYRQLVRRAYHAQLFRHQQNAFFSSSVPGWQMNQPEVFDRYAKMQHRRFAAREPDLYDYLKKEFGYRTADRIKDIKRRFECAVDYGCGRGYVVRHLDRTMAKKCILFDSCKEMLGQIQYPDDDDSDYADQDASEEEKAEMPEKIKFSTAVIDDERIPLLPGSVDLIYSSLYLHWVNDLPGVLRQFSDALKPDGCFTACMWGGQTLYELRSSLQMAELEREGGFKSHVSPFVQISDVGGLLNHAGFTLLTIDLDEIVVGYPSMLHLMKDLKGMGENNASLLRRLRINRDSLKAAGAIYDTVYGVEDAKHGRAIPATFQVVNMIGWKPDPTKQPKAAARGSGEISLKDLGDLDKILKERGHTYVSGDDKKQ